MADLFENWEKPNWDDYFMGMALFVSIRSIDPSAKHGSVIVGKNNKILSVGYNGPPQGSNDSKIPLTRPEKYLFMEHSEKNAIINRQLSIEGSTLYVTGYPCIQCVRSIIQSGIKRVVYGPFKSRDIKKEDNKAINILLDGRDDIIIEEYKGDILKCLKRSIEYFNIKTNFNKDKDKKLIDKENQIIYAVETKNLFPTESHYFQGFHPHNETNFEKLILENLKEVKRGPAENDPTHKQPIAYTLIVNPKNKSVFLYKRDGHEKRIVGNHSIGLGGHIEPVDSIDGNPIRKSVHREVLGEEITLMGDVIDTKVLGYINDDSNKVGEVHFGVLYLIETNGEVLPKDSEIKDGKLITLEELEEISKTGNLETWSEIALEPLKKYFSNLN